MIVFITDACSPMGAAIAHKFARQGETVVIAGQSREQLNMLAAELAPRSIPIVAELKTGSSLDSAMASLPKDCHSIDVLINTAGMTALLEPATQTNSADFASLVKAGTHTLLNTIRPILPFLRHQGGRILNLASAAHQGGYGQSGTCSMTKTMIDNVTRILGEELAEAGIHATCIVAGYNEASASPTDETGCENSAGQSLTLADIAEAAYWVATQASHRHVSHIDLLPTDLPFAATPRGRR